MAQARRQRCRAPETLRHAADAAMPPLAAMRHAAAPPPPSRLRLITPRPRVSRRRAALQLLAHAAQYA